MKNVFVRLLNLADAMDNPKSAMLNTRQCYAGLVAHCLGLADFVPAEGSDFHAGAFRVGGPIQGDAKQELLARMKTAPTSIRLFINEWAEKPGVANHSNPDFMPRLLQLIGWLWPLVAYDMW